MKRKAASEQVNDEDVSGRAAEFAAHLKALNSQFATWVRTQAAEHGDELWIDGARAYARQAEALLREYEDALGGGGGGGDDATPAAGPSGGKQPKAPAFAFGGGAAAGASSSSAAACGGSGGGGFLFGGGGGSTGSGAAAAPSGGFMFGSAAAGSSTPGGGGGGGGGFTFGATPSSSGTPAAGGADGTPPGAASAPSIFAFGGATASTAGHTPAPAKFSFGGGGGGFGAAAGSSPAPGGFSFPAAAANGGGAAADGGGEDGGGDAEEGPKSFTPEITVDEERYEVLFTTKSKLSILKKPADGGAGSWESRGLGTLSIRRFKQGGDKKPYIFFTTDAGKSLVMSPILESTKFVTPSGGGAAARRVSAYLQARDDELPQPGANAPPPSDPKYSYQNCMFLLGSADKASDFTAEVDKLKPSK